MATTLRRLESFLPTHSQWFALLLLLLLTSTAWRTMLVASDGDACMHWRVGEWMLQHRQIIDHDDFSHTRPGAPIISKEWLAELIFAGAGRWAGLYGLACVGAAVIAITFALLHRQLLRETGNLITASGITLLAAWAASNHWLARPHIFSFLLLFLWNDALRRQTGRKLTLCLAGLTLLWVNLHGGFLAGFVTLGAYWLGAAMERQWPRVQELTVTGLVCGLVSLLNPSGYRLHWHNIGFLQTSFLTDWLAEYSSVNFHAPEARGFLVWLASIFLTLVLVRPRLTASAGILLLVWTYFGLYATRNIPLLAIISAPIIAGALPAWRRTESQTVGSGWGWWLVAGAGILLAVNPRPTVMPAEQWPVKAVEFIRAHPEKFTGKMFNQYMWGGYLLEALPEHKVFVDGRTDFYGEGLIREFADVTALRPGWQKILRRHQVDWVLMPQRHRLNQALAALPAEWEKLHEDPVTKIWRRRS